MDKMWNRIKGSFTEIRKRIGTKSELSEGSIASIDSELSDETKSQTSTSCENSEKCQESPNIRNEEPVPLLDQQSYSELDVNSVKCQESANIQDEEHVPLLNEQPYSVVNPSKSTIESQEKEKAYYSLLNDLGLNHDVKFTLNKARIVDNNTINDETLTSLNEIPKYIVEKLMTMDYNARAFKLSMEQTGDLFDRSDKDELHHEVIKKMVNPMDAFLAVFHCADHFLRQDLAIKLSACQLSVPFLLPDPAQPSEKITMLLWALEGIRKSWKPANVTNENIRSQHVFVLDHPFPIVSFIRIGTNKFSKSALLNMIMSDMNKYHNFFFHRNCPGGGAERKIIDGLVELCWYLPGKRKHQSFQKEICFANLRGDARSYRKQMSVLTKVSSVVFLLLPSEYPQQSTKNILVETAKTEVNMVIVFKKKPKEVAQKYFDDFKQRHPGKLSLLQKSAEGNEADFVDIIRHEIGRNISTSKSKPLKEVSSFANDCGISIDESSDVNSQWRENIGPWIQMGPKDAKMKLKLQTQIPTLANLEREKFLSKPQANRSEKERIDDIYNKQQEAKKAQNESFAKVDEQIYRCLNRIVVMNDVEREYALTILKHELDKMSLQILGTLQMQYSDTWLNIQKKKKQLDSSDPQSDEEIHLKQLEQTIIESSFGLEHIIREMAQIFQLTSEISPFSYARAAADMLLSGQSLELMDGDSSYIPVKWFNAVFSELVRKTNNAKLFVISVLGIQSSGKSTMLNTMFGLEFPVSAGRCTRGAFASLIPVSDSLKSASNFDYMLIIDTEGLRGSEDPKARKHDNELATFAIGVADLTIVNIFGENYNVIKEFLGIAVHAFLKMKLVKEKRICQIVHQNVAAIEASDVLATERITLKRKLDEMAKLAAIEENCDDAFQELNDILSFDENDDVFYIPNRLYGSPPMAPVNPDYGRAVQEVKRKIISLMCSSERSHYSISQFQKRVCDLWKAILREDFILSFRNTIEVRAFTSLDKKYFEETMKTMVTGMTELEKKIQVSLMRSSADARDDIWSVSRMEIQEKAEELGSKMKKEMEDFFETSEDKTTLEQWKESYMNKITRLKNSQMEDVKQNCEATFRYWQRRQEVDIKKKTCKDELLEKARNFICSVENTDDFKKCEEKFEQEWQRWIEEVPPCKEKRVDVNQEMIEVLFYAEERLTGTMRSKLKEKQHWVQNFKSSCPSIMNQLNLHIFERFLQVFRVNPELIVDAEKIREDAISAAINFAKATLEAGVRCRPDDLRRMYHIVTSIIHDETKKMIFKFPDGLVCDTLLYVFANTYQDFYEMEERYIRERDIRGDLERTLRPELQNYFLNICQQVDKEVRAAMSMVGVLKKAMESELNKSMGPVVAERVRTISTFQSKGQFHASVLIQLGEQENKSEKSEFKSYTGYLSNPVKFLKDRLKESIEEYFLSNAENLLELLKLLKIEVEKIETHVLTAVSTATRQVRSSNKTFSFWIEEFVNNCSTLEITTEMFDVAAIDDDLKDFEMFESQLVKLLKEFSEFLIQRGVNKSIYKTWKPAPHEKLLDLMFGCQSYCPFCKGLCDQTARNHDNPHSMMRHRPQGITGFNDVNTRILDNRICTTTVDSDLLFSNPSTFGKWHLCKEYQTVNEYYKSWTIPPDQSVKPFKYWMWFMATFPEELANYYTVYTSDKVKPPEIPLSWKEISFEEARKELLEEFNFVNSEKC